MSSAAAPRTPRSLQTRLLTTVLALVLVAWGVAAALAWHETDDEVSDLLDAHLAQTVARPGACSSPRGEKAMYALWWASCNRCAARSCRPA
ncbi:MAG: hypothetical protein B7X79_19460 [Acidovorax sp. 17-64-282]|nr:MAG: hypothetical protein B7X79_19460 [Acidovorax sp. 17-64-282]